MIRILRDLGLATLCAGLVGLAPGCGDSGEAEGEDTTSATEDSDATESSQDGESSDATGSTEDTSSSTEGTDTSTEDTDTSTETSGQPAEPCNGLVQLCDRPLDAVIFPGTHNSHAVASEGFSTFNSNQGYPVPTQLEDGVRAFMLDTYMEDGQVVLCHGPCGLGSVVHAQVLGEVLAFLTANPNEVVIFLYQDAVSPAELAVDYASTGAIDRVYSHEPGAPWPTLGALIEADTRIVVTAEQGGPPPAWHHHLWSLAWDTPYGPTDADDLSCELNRGDPANDLFLVNHWVNNALGLPSAENADQVNSYAFLLARAEECWAFWDHPPNILAVDYYERGDLIEVAHTLNAR